MFQEQDPQILYRYGLSVKDVSFIFSHTKPNIFMGNNNQYSHTYQVRFLAFLFFFFFLDVLFWHEPALDGGVGLSKHRSELVPRAGIPVSLVGESHLAQVTSRQEVGTLCA